MKKVHKSKDELYSAALGLDNLFFVEKETGQIKEYYFNSESSHGGALVENVFYAEDLLKVAEQYPDAEDFYGYLEGECSQTYYDIDTECFESRLTDLLNKQERELYSFIGDNQDTMLGLIEFSRTCI